MTQTLGSSKGDTQENSPSSRNLILCFDGTANQFGPLPFTSVLKLYRLLENDDEDSQICYYQSGIGTTLHADFRKIDEGLISSQITKIKNKLDEMMAFSLDTHIIAALKFLVSHYHSGDRIYLFGFSRGAFTARIVAGFIEKVGLPNVGLEDMIGTAWSIYKNWENEGQPSFTDFSTTLVDEFRNTFSRKNVTIHFMGLWDSVNSCGIIRDRMFPYTTRTKIAKHVRHAVSIDERRSKYKQMLMAPCPCDGDNDEALIVKEKCSEDLVEIFFPGNHGDVGGGWPADLEGQCLSNIPLRWMIAECVKFGVIFKKGSLHEFDKTYPVYDSLISCHHDYLQFFRTRAMNHHEVAPLWVRFWEWILGKRSLLSTPLSASPTSESRSTSSTSSSVPITKFDSRGDEWFYKTLEWWLLEVLPIGRFLEDRNGRWRRVYTPNFGRHRVLPPEAKLHWSVYWRMSLVRDYEPANIGGLYRESEVVLESNVDRFRQSLTPFVDRSDAIEGAELSGVDWEDIPDDLQKLLQQDPTL